MNFGVVSDPFASKFKAPENFFQRVLRRLDGCWGVVARPCCSCMGVNCVDDVLAHLCEEFGREFEGIN